ncbi:hypothetical protein ACFY94_07690 [Streptomyces griseorubiginosus]|uniref:hypothetical protein n=1 Tax=Streptomyces griseorubiginosus TaxID=67304 RepID=UPI0036E85FD5
MSTPELPPSMLEAVRKLAAYSAQPIAQQALDRIAVAQRIRVNDALVRQQRFMGQRLAEQVAAALAPGQVMREQAVRDFQNTLNRSWSEKLAQVAVSQLRFDTGELDRALGQLAAWQQLDEGDRQTAADVLEEAFEQATSDSVGEAPEEMVSSLQETISEFEATHAGVIPRRMQRAVFVYFVGLLVIVALMQASFTSDTADELLGKGSELAPYAGVAMLAAGSAWDKYGRRPEDEEQDDDTDGEDGRG